MSPKHPHVLLIDDNRHGMIARRETLEDKGFLVTTASSGAVGVRAFDAGDFDLVVTDYKMPKMGGLQVLREIRSRCLQTPVVILSGCVEQLGLKEELLKEADAVLLKGPSELEDLLRTVSRLIKRRAAQERSAGSKDVKSRRRA